MNLRIISRFAELVDILSDACFFPPGMNTIHQEENPSFIHLCF